MAKRDSERAICSLCHTWASETGAMEDMDVYPQFCGIKRWLEERGYAHYLDFRSLGGADNARRALVRSKS